MLFRSFWVRNNHYGCNNIDWQSGVDFDMTRSVCCQALHLFLHHVRARSQSRARIIYFFLNPRKFSVIMAIYLQINIDWQLSGYWYHKKCLLSRIALALASCQSQISVQGSNMISILGDVDGEITMMTMVMVDDYDCNHCAEWWSRWV